MGERWDQDVAVLGCVVKEASAGACSTCAGFCASPLLENRPSRVGAPVEPRPPATAGHDDGTDATSTDPGSNQQLAEAGPRLALRGTQRLSRIPRAPPRSCLPKESLPLRLRLGGCRRAPVGLRECWLPVDPRAGCDADLLCHPRCRLSGRATPRAPRAALHQQRPGAPRLNPEGRCCLTGRALW